MRKINYFMNGFEFQYLFFKRQLSDIFDIILKTPNPANNKTGTKYIFSNLLLMLKLKKEKELEKYDIVQFNNTENFLCHPIHRHLAEVHRMIDNNNQLFFENHVNVFDLKKIGNYFIKNF